MNDAPEFIRLKRRRDEGSVNSLLIDDQKPVKRVKFVFKLTRTVEQQFYETDGQNSTPLLKLADNEHHHFVLEQNRKRRRESQDKNRGDDDARHQSFDDPLEDSSDGDGLPPEISQMLKQHLSLKGTDPDASPTTKIRKRSKRHYTGQAAPVISMPSLDYVYDIYHLEKVTEDEMSKFEKSDVGYVKIVNRDVDLIPDEETDSANAASDDQDSNEEGFYQNDYPEDEDDDRSILFGSEGEEVAADETADLIQSLYDSDRMPSSTENGIELKEQKEYIELFNQLGSSGDILNSLNAMNFVDLDDRDEDAAVLNYSDLEECCDNEDEMNDTVDDALDHEVEYARNTFFKSDVEDPLAVHRDIIFGKLQDMINKT
ncbi:hypothetical protein HG535_0D01670 [Zygotorulaspora mrakii]|uniref:Transcription factor Iwr1 domain-containing protein n=1 Tax=Zygotorulaspora mrakii TaxID=42260 RepID=A0A7H9B3D1_ZYGMR|nr:uncharacterized protein HG535_0D01670 [Zygotorulaspora mrakii]QLG72459.1 hypothetical protein HG535_0D01670 [Zygotorulaspora mrakii]